MFIATNRKFFFLCVIYILGLDIILDNVVKNQWDIRTYTIQTVKTTVLLCKVIEEQLQVLCCLPLRINKGNYVYCNFRLSIQESVQS